LASLANPDNTVQPEPNPCNIRFEIKNSLESTVFKLTSYTANGPPQDEVPVMLESTPQDAESPSGDVIFELPHHDRLHTILLCYRDVENEDSGFDVCTVVRLQGERDENNYFERAKQITMIRYISSQENYDSAIETRFATIYSKDNGGDISEKSEEPEYSQEHESLEYIVNVEHSYKSTSLLDFNTIIHIVSRELPDPQE
jgi:hypothetical protein